MFNYFNESLSLLASIIGIILIFIFILIEEKKKDLFYKLVYNKFWLINVFIIVSFYIFVHISNLINKEDTKDKNKLRDAVNKGLIAFIIAVFSSLDLTIIPFWFVFSFAYNTDLI